MAALAIANIVKSSLGPVGLDKMLVDDVGDVIVTNDGATILKQMEVEHPAAKVLVELAQLQDEEQQVHPTTVINGYRLACREAVRYMQGFFFAWIVLFNFFFRKTCRLGRKSWVGNRSLV
ncbi:unnamed protein product [Gongylonema pulchrum]|uniref:T-complex protein 1 subunit alpha n=1 Tax=Gongylonema pulchrum TaxID=637853 RepID=A0A183D4D1_9BILA|nr:unnamed protein product [Gongylonema pulchrum]